MDYPFQWRFVQQEGKSARTIGEAAGGYVHRSFATLTNKTPSCAGRTEWQPRRKPNCIKNWVLHALYVVSLWLRPRRQSHQTVSFHKGFLFSGLLYIHNIFFSVIVSTSRQSIRKVKERCWNIHKVLSFGGYGSAVTMVTRYRLLHMQAAPPWNYRIWSKSFLISGFLCIFEMNCFNCLNMVIAESSLRNNFFQPWGVPFLEKNYI